MEKPFIIINGVEGLVGTDLAYKFNENGYKICGLYDEAQDIQYKYKNSGLNNVADIVSIGDTSIENNCENIISIVNRVNTKDVIYIHALGVYPLELTSVKNIKAKYKDQKEIEDMIENLSYNCFSSMADALSKTDKNVKLVFFSVIKDKYYNIKYEKWWSVVDKVKKYMNDSLVKYKNLKFSILNISGVNTDKELLVNKDIPKEGDIVELYSYKQQDFIKNIYYEIIDSNNESGISEKDVYDRSEEYIYYY